LHFSDQNPAADTGFKARIVHIALYAAKAVLDMFFIICVADIPTQGRPSSSTSHRLTAPAFFLDSIREADFPVSRANHWNEHPPEIKSAHALVPIDGDFPF